MTPFNPYSPSRIESDVSTPRFVPTDVRGVVLSLLAGQIPASAVAYYRLLEISKWPENFLTSDFQQSFAVAVVAPWFIATIASPIAFRWTTQSLRHTVGRHLPISCTLLGLLVAGSLFVGRSRIEGYWSFERGCYPSILVPLLCLSGGVICYGCLCGSSWRNRVN